MDRVDRVDRATKPPFTIMGSLDGIEAGLRQMRRTRPLETTVVDLGGGLTVGARSDAAAAILAAIDEYYDDRSDASGSVLTSLALALADPAPRHHGHRRTRPLQEPRRALARLERGRARLPRPCPRDQRSNLRCCNFETSKQSQPIRSQRGPSRHW